MQAYLSSAVNTLGQRLYADPTLTQQTRYVGPTLVYCWPAVYDVGQIVNQCWVNVSFLLGSPTWPKCSTRHPAHTLHTFSSNKYIYYITYIIYYILYIYCIYHIIYYIILYYYIYYIIILYIYYISVE